MSNFKNKIAKPVELGKTGEEIAWWHLKTLGATCIEKVHTEKKLVTVKGVKHLVYTDKSSVDYYALIPGFPHGWLSSRIEVKLCDEDRLRHSRLKDHQVQWLLEYHYKGMHSFIIWVHKSKAYMFRYPSDYFKYGKSLTLEKAKQIAIWK